MHSKLLLFLMLFLGQLFNLVAQENTILKGKIVNAVTKEAISGATVLIQNTKTGASTGLDGSFSVNIAGNQHGTLVINAIGYIRKEIEITSNQLNLGIIELNNNSNQMEEVLVVSNNLAIDRKTPVAVSTIGYQQIQEKIGSQEFPELLKSVPGVYATKQGGGYGDSRINIRGFDSDNVAVTINGVPINDPVGGTVYWSNWAGLSSYTQSMQVQRGLGASKVAVPSIGGTVNITTKTTDILKGGFLEYGMGEYGIRKMSVGVSTGLLDNGWSFTLSAGSKSGDGLAEGLQYEAYDYFVNITKVINDKHTISFTGFGAPQQHGQRSAMQTIDTYRNAPQGIQYNAGYAIKQGEPYTINSNYYHKPQGAINHIWQIDEKESLSTTLYGSIGIGGGTGISENGLDIDNYRMGNLYTPYDFDAIIAANAASSSGQASVMELSSVNEHAWVGAISSYKNSFSEHFDFMAGLDLRYYKSTHYQEVTDLLGADFTINTADVNNPNSMARVGDKVNYYNNNTVSWYGAFVQGEYSSGPIAAYANLSVSNTGYGRTDHFLYANDDPYRQTDIYNYLGYQVKGGLTYNIDYNNSIFGNLGYFERAPWHNVVFSQNTNDVNADAVNEKVSSFELGYNFRSANFTSSLNLYHTYWMDKAFTQSVTGATTNETLFANIIGVDQLSQGIELNMTYQPTRDLTLKGAVSIGNWKWLNNVDSVQVFDQNQNLVSTISTIYAENMKIGNQPQTTVAAGLNWEFMPGVNIGADLNYFANQWARFDVLETNEPGLQVWKMPDYTNVDINLVYRFDIMGLKAAWLTNVSNLLNTNYITDGLSVFSESPVAGATPYNDATNTLVYYGIGRVITSSLRIDF